MTVRYQMDLKGLEAYLEKIAQAGLNIDEAAKKAVAAGGDVVFNAMDEKVPVGETGDLKANLERAEAQQDGNFIYVTVGMKKGVATKIAIYGNVQEYGSPTKNIPAQPYIRPAYDENKARVRAAEKAVLVAEGVI